MKELKFLNKYLLKYKWRLLLGIAFIFIANVFQIIPAALVRHSLDLMNSTYKEYKLLEGFEAQNALADAFIKTALLYALVILAVVFMRGVFLYFTRQTIIVMSRFIEYDLKNEIYDHYQTLPLAFYRRNNTGESAVSQETRDF